MALLDSLLRETLIDCLLSIEPLIEPTYEVAFKPSTFLSSFFKSISYISRVLLGSSFSSDGLSKILSVSMFIADFKSVL